MLNVLAAGIPEGDELLASLLHDPELGPVVLFAQKRDRKPDEVSPEEAAWLMAGSILELLEIRAGPPAAETPRSLTPRIWPGNQAGNQLQLIHLYASVPTCCSARP